MKIFSIYDLAGQWKDERDEARFWARFFFKRYLKLHSSFYKAYWDVQADNARLRDTLKHISKGSVPCRDDLELVDCIKSYAKVALNNNMKGGDYEDNPDGTVK